MPDYLTLLQFFLNHRRYLRSEDPSRVGKSPAELLTGEPHAHWLELLGYTRFIAELKSQHVSRGSTQARLQGGTDQRSAPRRPECLTRKRRS